MGRYGADQLERKRLREISGGKVRHGLEVDGKEMERSFNKKRYKLEGCNEGITFS